ncbi:MAG: gamma-glutamyl-gamma-aminobutyrate hydrolase family protein [Acidobacteria bacterium]|nr:gamma-glutamyl-gamma-aminobutyrate hydrolase family protein [Acidobacteriota bacterium]
MPLIAIARCSKLPGYEASVSMAGGTPWVVDPLTARTEDVIRVANGLLLTGGGDVRPDLYDATAHPLFSPAEAGRDQYEIELVRLALEADLPVFAICRGSQVLNVARGGTLVQDIPTELPGALEHTFAVPPHDAARLAHDIRILKRSLLATLSGGPVHDAGSRSVNSRHHQAVKALGEGLVATATAPDEVVEAIEDPARRFCLGVQWHPENFYRTGEFRLLFEGFVQACTR